MVNIGPSTQGTLPAYTSTLLFSPTPSNASLTSSDVSSSGSGMVHFNIVTNASNVINVSDTSPTRSTWSREEEGLSGGLIALLVGFLIVGAALAILVLYLKVTDKLHKFLPFKTKLRRRRSSTSSSHRPLDVDEVDTVEEGAGGKEDDSLPRTRQGNMFTIDDFEPVHDDQYSHSVNQEDYFYDEVFSHSVFEDEATKASMRHLYLATEQDDDEMFDVDAIVNSITGTRSSSATTATGKTS